MDRESYGSHSLSHSRLNTYQECHRKYYHEYIEGLDDGKESPALRMGSAFHEGMECGVQEVASYYKHNVEDKGPLATHEISIIQALIPYAAAEVYKLAKDSVNVYYEEATPDILSEHGGIYNGRLDARIVQQDGSIDIVDYKLLSTFSERDKKNVKYHPQLARYAMAEWMGHGTDPKTIRCHLLVAKKPNLYWKKGDTWAAYTARTVAEINKRAQDNIVLATVPGYTEQQLTYTYEAITQLDKELRDDSNPYTRNFSACYGKYGSCRYAPICHAPDRASADWIRSNLFTSHAERESEESGGSDGEGADEVGSCS